MKYVSVEHAAKMIGVSSATMRNWAKAGHICPASTRPLYFLEESVLRLKSKIGSESFGRLKTRANKRGSVSSFLPEEYAENSDLVSCIADIVACFKQENLAIEPVMFLAALRLLEQKGEVTRLSESALFNMANYGCWARQAVKCVIQDWRKSIILTEPEALYSKIYSLLKPCAADDFLGLLYQSLASEGAKSEQGAYYTPSVIVEDSLAQIDTPVRTFLDPCCGTGKYLVLAAITFGLSPDNIFGFDCDALAANITRINLLLAYKDKEFTPNIFCLDSLAELATGEIFCETNALLGKIDAIATNPPWGAYKNSLATRQFIGRIKSGETFSLFLAKSIELLRDGGCLSFLLPESILKIKTHTDIRSLILAETKIKKIKRLGRRFTGVYTPVIRLDLIKGSPVGNWPILIEENGYSSEISQDRFTQNENFTFDVEMASHEESLLKKIFSIEHFTLAKNAEWALGVVTGDNKKFLLDTQQKYAEPIFRGSDVFPYRLGKASTFIHFTPAAFQQTAPERLFRVPEKLVYKFISKRLVFAYDDKQQLTLNSANILIPSIPGMGIKVVLAFLNSAVFQYVFMKKFATHKVLRGDLERLPFPLLTNEVHTTIEHLVDMAIITGKEPRELESIVFSSFQLTEEERFVIKQTTKDLSMEKLQGESKQMNAIWVTLVE